MSRADFWDDQENAREVIGRTQRLKRLIGPAAAYRRRVDDLLAMTELVEESSETEGSGLLDEVAETAAGLYKELDELETRCFLGGDLDPNNAIVSIHAGAGGTESCDWAEMLLRMYTRWAERRGFKAEIQDLQTGEEAGLNRASFRLLGDYAYGLARAERGVHRLVRISPFDANRRRHTSFAAVDVIAEVEDDAEIDLNEDEMRIDTFRSSGKGGQHVNKTDSAVRITHLPTNIVVTCQNERSQHKNKATALRILKSRLYEKMQDEKRAANERIYGEKNEIGWGNQIRSYVFQPYQLVTDLRTGLKEGNLQQVMDGGLDKFINAWLRAGCPASRNKEIKVEE